MREDLRTPPQAWLPLGWRKGAQSWALAGAHELDIRWGLPGGAPGTEWGTGGSVVGGPQQGVARAGGRSPLHPTASAPESWPCPLEPGAGVSRSGETAEGAATPA